MNLYHKKKYRYSQPSASMDFIICQFIEKDEDKGFYMLQVIYHSRGRDLSEVNEKLKIYASEQYWEAKYNLDAYFQALEDLPYSPVLHNLT